MTALSSTYRAKESAMSTDTVFTPAPVKKVAYEITTWRGRFVGLTDDEEYAKQAAESGYLVKEV